MSLRTRIAAIIAITVLLASAIAGLGAALSTRNVGIDRLDDALLVDAARVGNRPLIDGELRRAVEFRQIACAADTGDNGSGRQLSRQERRDRFLPEFASTMQLVRPNGLAFGACEELPVEQVDRAIASSGTGIELRTVTIDGDRFRLLTQGYGERGAIQFARPLDLTEDTMRGLLSRIIGFGVAGAVLAGGAGWFMARRTTGPVRQLSDAAEHVARTGNLGERLAVSGSDELAGLATSFNTMLESLDTSRAQQRRLVQDASHELRTPLTSIRTNIELLQRHPEIDADVRSTMLDDISSELIELTELTTELVESATEVSADPSQAVAFDLAELTEQCVERGRRRHRRSIDLVVEPGDRTDAASSHVVVGDAGLVTRAITNLINNAVKFTEADTVIEVRCAGTTLRVIDGGPGVPAADLANIFDRFYRTDDARQSPGSGLGLAIVKQVIEQHGGEVSAHNRSEGGLDIGFTLPPAAAG